MHAGNTTYKNFRIWLDDSSPTEEMWQQIMEDDEKFDYSHTDNPPPVQEEISVYTTSSAANTSGQDDSDPED